MLHIEKVGEGVVGIPIEFLRTHVALGILECAPEAKSFADQTAESKQTVHRLKSKRGLNSKNTKNSEDCVRSPAPYCFAAVLRGRWQAKTTSESRVTFLIDTFLQPRRPRPPLQRGIP